MNVREQLALKCFLVLVVLVSVAAGLPLDAQTPEHPGQYAQADIEHGFRVYTERCLICHGVDGAGVGSVDLRGGRFRRAATDRQLIRLITTGIPEVGMPPNSLTEPEQVSIVSYLRNMNGFDADAVILGDPARGHVIFEGRGSCTQCHRTDGTTTGMAPDLSGIGAVRTPSALQRSLLEPSAAMLPINRPIHVVTRGGRVINGRRLNEDTYTVQLMDDEGRLMSLDKADLREYTILAASPMPTYRDKLNTQDIADMVAYLVSLKGS